jgi:hypothetical protein
LILLSLSFESSAQQVLQHRVAPDFTARTDCQQFESDGTWAIRCFEQRLECRQALARIEEIRVRFDHIDMLVVESQLRQPDRYLVGTEFSVAIGQRDLHLIEELYAHRIIRFSDGTSAGQIRVECIARWLAF